MLGSPYPVLVIGSIKQGLVTVIVSSEILFIGWHKSRQSHQGVAQSLLLTGELQSMQEAPPLPVGAFVTGPQIHMSWLSVYQ